MCWSCLQPSQAILSLSAVVDPLTLLQQTDMKGITALCDTGILLRQQHLRS